MLRLTYVSVRLTLVDGLEELWKLKRAEWVLRWPGQVVIAGSQTAWTCGVEAAIAEFRMDYYMEEMLAQVTMISECIVRLFPQFGCGYVNYNLYKIQTALSSVHSTTRLLFAVVTRDHHLSVRVSFCSGCYTLDLWNPEVVSLSALTVNRGIG